MSEQTPKSRRRVLRWLIELAIVVAVFLAIQAWQQRDVPNGAPPLTAGVLADGQGFTLEAWRQRHAGHAVALHFWAEWCPICGAEEGSVTAVARDWPVMTVAMRSGEADQVMAYLKQRGLDWPALVDADGRIAAAYGLKGVPAFIVIDRAGLIRSVSVGYTTEWGMRARLWWANRG